MTSLSVQTVKSKMHGLKAPSPYPDLRKNQQNVKLALPEERLDEKLYIGYGVCKNYLPYTLQDDYDCTLKERDLKQIVLENEKLRAVFLPEFGCRLASLYHKEEGREILYCNESIRFADVALRNAWFAGGVEWNCGMRGHSPFTSDNVFCQSIETPEGPMLRFYEWERIRRVWFEGIAYLPQGSEQLFFKMRIINSSGEDVPMYWWSNIAVPETVNTRVITNAEDSYYHGYGGVFTRASLPYIKGVDITYSTRAVNAVDYFFRTLDGEQKFVMAAEESGYAMYQTSTDLLKSRKLFCWGMSPSGRNWQRRLCGPVDAYLEIQAGLARTQFECVPMEKDRVFEWAEAYGLTKVDRDKAFSRDWTEARSEAARKVAEKISREALEQVQERIAGLAEAGKKTLIHTGSAWAALENKRANNAVFSQFAQGALSDAQKPWLELLETGSFPCPEDVSQNPAGYMAQRDWIPLLQKAAGENWYAHFHLGILYYAQDEYEKARKTLERSLELRESPWVLYCLSELEYEDGNYEKALAYIWRAWAYKTGDYRIFRKLAAAAEKAGAFEKIPVAYDALSPEDREKGRAKLLLAMGYLKTGKLAQCEEILLRPLSVEDVREGEKMLDELWIDYCAVKFYGGRRSTEIEKEIAQKHPAPFWLTVSAKV